MATSVAPAPIAEAGGLHDAPDGAEHGLFDRVTWAVTAGVVLLVALALTSVTVLQPHVTPPDLSRPEGIVRAYEEAIDSRQPDRAWDLLALSARADVTREEFLRRATAYAQHQLPSRLAIEDVVVEGAIARVATSRTFATNSIFGPPIPTIRTTVRLIREEGRWQIEVPSEPQLISGDPQAIRR